jgi:hypothetical protein
LIVQTADLAVLGRVCEYISSNQTAGGKEATVLAWERFFDTVGAIACDEVRGRISATGQQSVVLLAGPLHFVDYWTPGVQDGFWSFLSLYSLGPGVVVADTPRTEAVENHFVARGTIPGTEIRYLRSRLVVTEEAPL